MKIRFSNKTIPIALFFACFLSYGLLIPWLGFYWDDWPYTWFAHVLGPGVYKDVFAGDRPFLSIIYSLTSQLIDDKPIYWQLFCIFSRWIAVLAFWWSMRTVWVKSSRPVSWAAFIFAVFPGFSQQWISVIYSRAFLLMAVYFASFGLMAKAIRSHNRFYPFTILAVLCSAFALLSTEYFFGLELLRPVFIIYILYEQSDAVNKKVVQTLKHWSPYLITWLAFAVWRVFFFSSENYDIQAASSFYTHPKEAIIQLLQMLTGTFFDSSISIWTQTLKILTLPVNSLSSWLTISVIVTSFAVAVFYLLKLKSGAEENNRVIDQWGMQAIIAGVLGIFLAIIPFWAAGLPIKLIFPWDRFMLVIMIGSSLLFVGLLEYLVKTDKRKVIILSLAIALSIGKHFETANTFRRDWNNQKDFFWQLTWRIPAIEPNTILMTHELPFQYYSDNSLTAPLNWIYASDLNTKELPYLMIYTKARLGNSLPNLSPQQSIKYDYRSFEFNGNLSNSIVFYHSTSSCLRILDSTYTSKDTIKGLPYQLTDAIPLSNFERIITNPDKPAQMPVQFFYPEPTHDWCYYFEKAELARQNGDWDKVIELAKETEELELEPKQPSELLPFIEGYLHAGDFEKAESLTRSIQSYSDPHLLTGLCNTWERFVDNNQESSSIQNRLSDTYSQLHCSQIILGEEE